MINGNVVYVTISGSKYHKENCYYLKKSKIKINLTSAHKNYSPCLRCMAPTYMNSSSNFGSLSTISSNTNSNANNYYDHTLNSENNSKSEITQKENLIFSLDNILQVDDSEYRNKISSSETKINALIENQNINIQYMQNKIADLIGFNSMNEKKLIELEENIKLKNEQLELMKEDLLVKSEVIANLTESFALLENKLKSVENNYIHLDKTLQPIDSFKFDKIEDTIKKRTNNNLLSKYSRLNLSFDQKNVCDNRRKSKILLIERENATDKWINMITKCSINKYGRYYFQLNIEKNNNMPGFSIQAGFCISQFKNKFPYSKILINKMTSEFSRIIEKNEYYFHKFNIQNNCEIISSSIDLGNGLISFYRQSTIDTQKCEFDTNQSYLLTPCLMIQSENSIQVRNNCSELIKLTILKD